MPVKINPSTLQFLRKLGKNNNREWFAENRERYIAANLNVVAFVEKLIEETGTFDEEILKLDPKKALFRIYRDTRFSPDKTPYKTNLGVGLAFKRGNGSAGYYLHIQPGKSFLAGGLYLPERDALGNVRKAISLNKTEFLKILQQDDFRNNFRGLSVEHKLTRVPNGFEKDDSMAEYLKLKSFNVIHPVSDEALMRDNAAHEFALIFESMKPLNDFLNQALNLKQTFKN